MGNICMKRILLFSIILWFSSCENDKFDDERYRNENYGWFVDEETGVGQWLKLGNQKPDISGDYIVFFFNGNVRETGRIKNGIHIDTTIIYDLNGNPIKYYFENPDLKYHHYLHDGEYKAYHPNGDLRYEGIVKNNKESIPWKGYYESGSLSIHNYMLNDSISAQLMYYDSGNLKDSSGTLNGKAHGVQKHWYRNGKLRYLSHWKFLIGNKAKKKGVTKGYFEKGGISYKYYFKSGQKNGLDTNYFENGNLRAIYTMKNDKRDGLAEAFYSDGSKYFEANYNEGLIGGELKRYGLDGSLRQIEYYNLGKSDDENFTIVSEFTEKEIEEIKHIQRENDRYQNIMKSKPLSIE
jgi:antitoxin component YwqK of YwqJK toxin-antitoxin module